MNIYFVEGSSVLVTVFGWAKCTIVLVNAQKDAHWEVGSEVLADITPKCWSFLKD